MGVLQLAEMNLLGNSDFGEAQFVNFARDVDLRFVYTNVVPNPETSNLQIVKQFRVAAKEQGVILDTFSLEAYIATDLLLYVLRRITGDITKKAILDQLVGMKDREYKGLDLAFDPETRTLLHTLWLDTGKREWVVVHAAAE